MKNRSPLFLLVLFLALWAASFWFFYAMGDWSKAGNIGDSFGAISALFSGAALAMAIYAMVLQQQQAADFESRTLQAQHQIIEVMQQQSKAIGLIEKSLEQQANNAHLLEQSLQRQAHAGRVAALTFMIERQEQRIDNLRDWGRKSYQDEKHYQRGIDAAQRRIDEYEVEIGKLSNQQPA
jgi:hypothetical protein